MKKQLLSFVLLLNLGLLFPLKSQQVLPDFEEVSKLEALSSDNEESMPFPYLGGEKIYFVRTVISGSMKQRVKGQDIWSSEFDGAFWRPPSNLFEAGNDNGNNGVIGVSNDGNTLYLFNSIQTRRKLAKGIAVTTRDSAGNWSDLKKVDVPGFRVGQGLYSFYMTPTEDILLIGMAPTDSSTQSDLYVSLKSTEGNWGQLINLGTTINTSGNEITPFIDESGTNLYFSSDEHQGNGGMDIFTAKRLDDSWTNWSTPTNLGKPINSDAFDAYFMFSNEKEAFFTSNRDGTYSDIYWAKIKQEEIVPASDKQYAQLFFKTIPNEDIDLLIIDENGEIVEERTTDDNGKFSFNKIENDDFNIKMVNPDSTQLSEAKMYLTDKNGYKIKRLNLNSDGSFQQKEVANKLNSEVIAGVFEFKNLPTANIPLVIVDENGFPIDTVMTDENGNFSYEKLKTDNNFTIRPIMTEDDDLVDVEIFSVDEKGQKEAKIEVNTSVPEVFPEPDQTYAELYFKTIPNDDIDLLIINEEGDIVEKRTTDEKGKFSFNKLDNDNYNIQIEDADSTQLSEAKIYLTDKNGVKIKRMSLNSDGSFQSEELVNEFNSEIVEGVLEFDNSPKANIPLVIIDENGFPIDTVMTDENGNFSYEKLKTDNNFTIRPLMNSEDDLVDNMEIFMTDENGGKGSKIEINKEAINQPVTPKDVIVDNKNPTNLKKKMTVPNEEYKINNNELIVYFNFNETVLTEDDKLILDKVVAALKINSTSKVTMIGFTDNIGSKEVNVRVASARARAARAYLTENGISRNKITIYGYGEVMFKGDNATKQGRALNRRVEISLE